MKVAIVNLGQIVSGNWRDPFAAGDTIISEGERIEGSVAMAVPLFRDDGIVGAIAVVGPAFRCDEAWRTRSGRLLQAAGKTINEELAEDRYQ